MITINAIAVLAHITFGLWIWNRERFHTVLFGFVLFVQTWSLVSCFYNDLGIYNFELFRATETTLATTRLALFYLIFNLGFLLAASLLRKRPLARRDFSLGAGDLRLGNLKLSAYFLGLLLIAYIAYSFASGGIPILEGIDKVLFYKQAGPVERFLLGYGFIIAFVLGYFRRQRGRFSVNGLLLILMLVYLVMTGNKFSALMKLAISYWAAVFVVHVKATPGFKVIRLRYVVIGGITVLVLVAGAYASYLFWNLNPQEAQQLLLDRVLALQGHLWWATDYRLFVLDGFDSNHWLAELQAVVNLGQVAEGSVGMKYVMVQAIGPEKAFPIFDIGYLYTMAYPAILVLTFPYPVALVLQLLVGGMFCGVLYYLYYSLLYRHFVRALIAFTVVMPFLGVLGSGDLWVLLTPGVVFKLLILLSLELAGAKSAPGAPSDPSGGAQAA